MKPLLDLRRSLVLDLFISHFIEIAAKCMYYDAVKRAIGYLKQAKRLTILLSEDVYRGEEVSNYFERISKEEKIAQSILLSKQGSDLPKTPESSASSESSWRRTSSIIRQEEEFKVISDKKDSRKNTNKNAPVSCVSQFQSTSHNDTITKENFIFTPHSYSFKDSPLFKSVK